MSNIKANTIENLAGTESHDVATMGIGSGSNVDGEYTKFPDGTLIMYGTGVLEQNASYDHVAVATTTFPSTLINIEAFGTVELQGTPSGQDARSVGIKHVIIQTVDTLYVAITAPSGSDLSTLWGITYGWQVIGRWK